MTTLTIKINEHTKAGKAFMAMSESFFKGVKRIEIIETNSDKSEGSHYNPVFSKMILERFADIKTGKSKCITLDTNDIWGSLGLK